MDETRRGRRKTRQNQKNLRRTECPGIGRNCDCEAVTVRPACLAASDLGGRLTPGRLLSETADGGAPQGTGHSPSPTPCLAMRAAAPARRVAARREEEEPKRNGRRMVDAARCRWGIPELGLCSAGIWMLVSIWLGQLGVSPTRPTRRARAQLAHHLMAVAESSVMAMVAWPGAPAQAAAPACPDGTSVNAYDWLVWDRIRYR